jgi:hypothetical protein
MSAHVPPRGLFFALPIRLLHGRRSPDTLFREKIV